MGAFFNPFLEIIKDVQPFTYIAVAIVILAGGGFLLLGGEKGRQKVKENALWVLLGIALILGAIVLASYLVGKWTF